MNLKISYRSKGCSRSPIEVAEKLQAISEKNKCNQFRISGAEPIIGRTSAQHLAEIIRLVDGHFIIETNGIALGHDISLLDLLRPLKCHIRLTIKGDDLESFQKVTGALGEAFYYQLQAVDAIRKEKISLSVAVMTQFVDSNKLPCRVDEEEDLITYQSTERIMRKRGL